jgi:HSP20 family protein
MVEVAVGPEKEATTPPMEHPFHAPRNEMDRLFDRFAAGFRMATWRGLFDIAPALSPFDFAAPAVDVIEDDNAFKIMAEMPGLEEKDIELSISGDMLTLKGEKRQEKEEKNKNRYLSERPMARSNAASRCPTASTATRSGQSCKTACWRSRS